MKWLMVALACFVSLFAAGSKEKRYPVADIPPEILKNADFIVRLSNTEFEVKSLNHAILSRHLVVTILKESALNHATFEQYYDNFTIVKSIGGAMYDAEGSLVKEFKSDDINDLSAVEDGTMYSDDRVKVIRPVSAYYPFTVDYYVELSSKRILAYPSWMPLSDYRQSVQSAKLTLRASEGLFPRIYTRNLPANTIVELNSTENTQSWEVRDLQAIEYEPLSPGLRSMIPIVLTAPEIYTVKGYTGDFTTWKGVGLWVGSMIWGRDTLDAKYSMNIKAAVDAESDTLMKVKRIYRYMQQNCRYVNTNVGIGGWQPQPANDVGRLGYGDCKGLVNYTKSLLKVFGIRSIYALVSAGQGLGGILTDFPSNQFNHVILAVPVGGDTVWLECTDPGQPFGFIGSFTDNRNALLITSEGGRMVRTPSYPGNVNSLKSRISIEPDTTGTAAIVKRTDYSGLQYEDMEELLALNPEKLRERTKELYDMPGLSLNSVQLNSSGDLIPSAHEIINVKVRNYAAVTGKRMFVPLNRFLDEPGLLKKDPNRKQDLMLRMSYVDFDTLVLHLPTGFSVESYPQPLIIKNQFGQMQAEIKREEDKLILYRKLEIVSGSFPPAAFNEFVAFLQQVARQDKARVVLIRE